MEPIFKKCLMAIERINENSFPMMEQAYKSYIDMSKQKIISSQCLNDSKAYAVAAIDTISSGQIDNTNVKSELSRLEDIDKRLKKKSKDLHELLSRNNIIARCRHQRIFLVAKGVSANSPGLSGK